MESVFNLQNKFILLVFLPHSVLLVSAEACWGFDPVSLRHFSASVHQKDIHYSASLHHMPTVQAVEMQDRHIHVPALKELTDLYGNGSKQLHDEWP